MSDYNSSSQDVKSDIAATAKSIVNGTHPQIQHTKNDFNGLANSRPDDSDEPLTHFHSFFYDLFTWRYPRATAFIAVSVLSTILAFHYVNVLRYVFKGAYLLFASVAILEGAGKPLGVKGFVSQMRPRRYYTIPRESLESIFAELHDLMNFFVVEFQRVIFVENIFTTIMAFLASFVGYFLIKYLPIWGLLFLSAIAAFTGPLVYLNNQEAIDEQIHHISEIVNEKLSHARDVGNKYAEDAAARVQVVGSQLSEKVQTFTVRKTPEPRTPSKAANGRAVDSPPHITPTPTGNKPLVAESQSNIYNTEPAKPYDFPPAPTHEPAPPAPNYPEDSRAEEYRAEIAS